MSGKMSDTYKCKNMNGRELLAYDDNIKMDLLKTHFNNIDKIMNFRVKKGRDLLIIAEPVSVTFNCGTTYIIVLTVHLGSS
jgi:hypothetical protein